MRLLYITEIYPDPSHGIGVWGGGEKQFYEISRRMAKRGHDVSVLTCRFPGQAAQDVIDGVRIFRLGLTRDPETGGAKRTVLPIIAYVLETAAQGIRLRPDLVHCNTYFPVYSGKIVSLLQNVPMIATFHDLYGLRGWIHAQRSLIWGFLGHVATIAAAKLPPDLIIAVSPQCRQKLAAIGVRREEISVIPNGVDLKLFDSVRVEKIPSQILYVGRLVQFKHVELLLYALSDVMKKVPKATLKIVGHGPERVFLERLTKSLNLENKVTFAGVTRTYEDVARFFKESALFVLPSTVEGESLAVKEAMACGLPVIAMRVPGSGVLSLIQDGVNGYLVQPDQPAALAEKIVGLLQNEAKRRVLGEAARDFIGKHDWEVVTDSTERVYSRILKLPAANVVEENS